MLSMFSSLYDTQTRVNKPAVSFPEQVEEEAEYEACVEHAIQQSASARGTIDALKPKYVRISQLGRRIKMTKKDKYNYYLFADTRKVLTLPEEEQLSAFIREASEQDDGQKRRDNINAKLVRILEQRKANNRQRGRKCVPLSAAAHKVLAANGRDEEWLQQFYREHTELQEMEERDEDEDENDIRPHQTSLPAPRDTQNTHADDARAVSPANTPTHVDISAGQRANVHVLTSHSQEGKMMLSMNLNTSNSHISSGMVTARG